MSTKKKVIKKKKAVTPKVKKTVTKKKVIEVIEVEKAKTITMRIHPSTLKQLDQIKLDRDYNFRHEVIDYLLDTLKRK